MYKYNGVSMDSLNALVIKFFFDDFVFRWEEEINKSSTKLFPEFGLWARCTEFELLVDFIGNTCDEACSASVRSIFDIETVWIWRIANVVFWKVVDEVVDSGVRCTDLLQNNRCLVFREAIYCVPRPLLSDSRCLDVFDDFICEWDCVLARHSLLMMWQ